MLWLIGVNSLVAEKTPANEQLNSVVNNKYLYVMKVELTRINWLNVYVNPVLHYQLQVYKL